MRSFRWSGPVAAVALVYVATFAMLPPGGLWIIDNGNKRIQVEALLASGFRDFSLPWPGLDLDPELAFNPLPNAFSVVSEGRLYSVFSPFFPALSSLPFHLLGDAGLCLLPLLASLAAAAWALGGAIYFAVGFATAASPIERLLRSNGFFAAAPLLVIGMLRFREPGLAPASERVIGWLLRLVAGYALLYFALTPLRNTTGIHWGNRYLLELYPLLAVPCAAGLLKLWRGLETVRWAAVVPALLAAMSIALQVFSIDLLRRKLVFGENLERAVRERPESVVLTDVWWVPQTLAHAFFDKSIFLVSGPEQGKVLLARLAEHGFGELLFVTADSGRSPNPRAIVVEDEGLGFFSLRLERHALSRR